MPVSPSSNFSWPANRAIFKISVFSFSADICTAPAFVSEASPAGVGLTGRKSDDSYASYQASDAGEISRIASILKAAGVPVKDVSSASTGRLIMREAEVSCASGPALYTPFCSVFVVP